MKFKSVLSALVARASLFTFVLMFGLSAGAFAQLLHRDQAVTSMKLFAPNVGWAATGKGIFWTSDGGTQWKNITPPIPLLTLVKSVFFVNSSTGWALLAGWQKGAGEPQFSLASTTNGGASWSITQVIIPKQVSATLFAPAGHIAFADSLHGWMNLDITSSSNFDFGGLLITLDGGRSWQLPPSAPGIAGSVGLVTTKEGWLVGGPDDLQFYMTHDGAKSWQGISLPAPAGIYSADPLQMYAATHPAYDLPTFKDPDDGVCDSDLPRALAR